MTTNRKLIGANCAAWVCAVVLAVVSMLTAGCGTLHSKPWDSPIKTVEWMVEWPHSPGIRGILDLELQKLDGVLEAKMALTKPFEPYPMSKKGGPSQYRLAIKYDSRKMSRKDLVLAVAHQSASIPELWDEKKGWYKY